MAVIEMKQESKSERQGSQIYDASAEDCEWNEEAEEVCDAKVEFHEGVSVSSTISYNIPLGELKMLPPPRILLTESLSIESMLLVVQKKMQINVNELLLYDCSTQQYFFLVILLQMAAFCIFFTTPVPRHEPSRCTKPSRFPVHQTVKNGTQTWLYRPSWYIIIQISPKVFRWS